MPRHQSKISFGVQRGGHTEQVQRLASTSKHGIESRPAASRSVPVDKKEDHKIEHSMSGQTVHELLFGPEAQNLLAEMQKDGITRARKADPLSPGERVLHIFDVTAAYGPAQGLSRLERWERARRFGKNPPKFIETLLKTAKESPDYERYKMSVFGHLQ